MDSDYFSYWFINNISWKCAISVHGLIFTVYKKKLALMFERQGKEAAAAKQ